MEDLQQQFFEFEITYKPKDNNEENVRILGKRFVNRNKNNCSIIYKDKEYV